MALSQLHEFHFVIAGSMEKSLKNLDIWGGFRSLSGIIVKVLSLLAPLVKREHKWGEQRMSRYMPVSGNPDEKRAHVHVYLPGNVYRWLKLMHQDLNVFSIAQLVRDFLEVFLEFVDVYGDDVVEELERLFKGWNKEGEKTRLTTREFVRQLLRIIRHLPGQDRLINVYDGQFSPFWILRL